MCEWKKCVDAAVAERDAERTQGKLAELREAVEDHRRGLLSDDDLYGILDAERILAAQIERDWR